MASYNDPNLRFAPLEVIDRLLAIRQEFGFSNSLSLDRTAELADILDAYGFDIYSFTSANEKLNYDSASTPLVPGGDAVRSSQTVH